ncbi:Uncharacterised protein [Bordetella pertussis]|nr:Uncharacterised protein [Bordetella pertussis]CFW42583.1 Uncharacterised protein [Bordetella pertussis]
MVSIAAGSGPASRPAGALEISGGSGMAQAASAILPARTAATATRETPLCSRSQASITRTSVGIPERGICKLS